MFTVANSIHPNASTISPIHRQTTITAAIISTTSTAASLSSSNSTTEVKNNAFEDLYSPMTGIKTGATLSGMFSAKVGNNSDQRGLALSQRNESSVY